MDNIFQATDRLLEFRPTPAKAHNYLLKLKISLSISKHSQMTTLLYVKDYLRQQLRAEVLQFYFDEDNMTNEEEILSENMIEEVLIKIVTYQEGAGPITDEEEKKLEDKHESIYVNSKGQLVKITPVERNGKMTELHQILAFDVDKLPQADTHKFGMDQATKQSQLTMIPRAKVPVKDGMSQSKFIMENRGKSSMVENPNDHYYTLEEVAQHQSEEDCWTILNGRIYDVTQYAKVHPGGRKIFLGKGKDCTELYNKYHPWVNGAALIGKYQVGVVKK